MTTTTPNAGQTRRSPNKNGDNDVDTSAKAKAKLEANKEKKKKRKQKEKESKKDNNNNNYVRFDGLITEGIMKGVTVSPGSSASMTTDFRNFKKSAAAYAVAKGYGHWPGVIKTSMEPVEKKEWKMKRLDKGTYAVKRTTKLETEGAADIMKQEWIVIDYEKQEEAEDNYSNIQRQKLTEHALYRKNSAAMFTVLYGQLHSEIITIAKQSTAPDFTTMHKERDVVGLLSILCDICVQNLTGTKVDPYLEQLRILTSTLSCV